MPKAVTPARNGQVAAAMTPHVGAAGTMTTGKQQQQQSAAAALLPTLQTPQHPQSPVPQKRTTGGGIQAAILKKQRPPYNAVASQKKVLKQMDGLAPGGGLEGIQNRRTHGHGFDVFCQDGGNVANNNVVTFNCPRNGQGVGLPWPGYCV
mmetsp:Transcript_40728/g.85279  ORF Transcript_40728/g.85279 Transcript_40728/m.85279 type:complete len:150 (-) Transcript_40728:70-519(-)